jgi:hypothetical protein
MVFFTHSAAWEFRHMYTRSILGQSTLANHQKYIDIEDYIPLYSFFDVIDTHSSKNEYSNYEYKDRSVDIRRMLRSVMWAVLNLENKMLEDINETNDETVKKDIDFSFRT